MFACFICVGAACISVCVCVRVVPECHPYLHQHDEAHEEGEEGYSQQEELPAVFTAEHGRVHVDYGCHKAFDTHKLMGRERRERGGSG